MTAARALPSVMMLLSIGSAVVYALDGDWRRGLYWAAAALLTFAVTW